MIDNQNIFVDLTLYACEYLPTKKQHVHTTRMYLKLIKYEN